MIYTKRDALEAVVNMSVADIHPTELREIAAKLSDDFSEALGEFCNQFNLGDWFYDSLTLAEIDIADLLNAIADEEEKNINETLIDYTEINLDLRKANGWPA